MLPSRRVGEWSPALSFCLEVSVELLCLPQHQKQQPTKQKSALLINQKYGRGYQVCVVGGRSSAMSIGIILQREGVQLNEEEEGTCWHSGQIRCHFSEGTTGMWLNLLTLWPAYVSCFRRYNSNVAEPTDIFASLGAMFKKVQLGCDWPADLLACLGAMCQKIELWCGWTFWPFTQLRSHV